MSNINDLKLSNLATLGYTGSIQDAELAYLGSLVYTGTVQDRLKQLWGAAGFSNEKDYLLDKGYSGSVQDMLYDALVADDYYV